MSIYIPNIEMPESCDNCPHPTCTLWQSTNGGERHEKCSIVPVTEPHGRLIDADALREDWLENGENAYVYDTNAFLFSLDDAPTIIPEDHIGDANQMVNNDYAGLKVKYIVRKASNGELVDDCFVLRPDKDKAAIAALNTYADATKNQVLAADIRKWLSTIIPAEGISKTENTTEEGET